MGDACMIEREETAAGVVVNEIAEAGGLVCCEICFRERCLVLNGRRDFLLEHCLAQFASWIEEAGHA